MKKDDMLRLQKIYRAKRQDNQYAQSMTGGILF